MVIAIIGGDLRAVFLGKLLSDDGHYVKYFGFDNKYIGEKGGNLAEIIDKSDVVIGPLLCSNDNVNLNATLYSENIRLEDIFNFMNKEQIFIAGNITEQISKYASLKEIETVDLLKREELTVLNAIPTAEGAIQLAMEKMPITLHNSNVMIIGYGRIGKILCKMLYGIGANVHVSARKTHDLAYIKSFGYNPISSEKLIDSISDMDIIFNTVPNLILDKNILEKVGNESIIIDLASKPGGVDFKEAEKMGIKTYHALSLPGKSAPLTAADYIRHSLYNILIERGYKICY
jgi:dipicolinate synthase subunit A